MNYIFLVYNLYLRIHFFFGDVNIVKDPPLGCHTDVYLFDFLSPFHGVCVYVCLKNNQFWFYGNK